MPLTREDIAAWVARDLPDGACVNLGIGMPTAVPRFVNWTAKEVVFHSENGVLGVGPPPLPGAEDPDLINAGKEPITVVPGACFITHTEAFAMIRGGHVDFTILGAFQVSAWGDLANWAQPDDPLPAVGGAVDLAQSCPTVWVMTTVLTRDGRPKLVDACTYPLTARAVVRRAYTDWGIMEPRDGAFHVVELAPGAALADLERLIPARLVPGREPRR